MTQERWATLPEYPNYQISDHGHVLGRYGRVKSPSCKYNGYLQVVLYTVDGVCHQNIHRLVAKAFVANPQRKPQVNHRDGNKWNNHYSNLEWVTPQENIQHGLASGLLTKGEDRYNAKLTEKQARDIKFNTTDTLKTLADRYDVSLSNIWNIRNNVSWRHIK